MSVEDFREHHRAIRDRLARRSERALERGERDDLNALIALLEGDLLVHARAERDHMYPAVDELVRQHGRATATMDIDHEVIAKRVRTVALVVERLRVSRGRERTEAKRALREALLRLEALLDVHMEKEERVYVPLIETHLSVDERRALLGKMHADLTEAGAERTLDARTIPVTLRHDEIFAMFDRLAVGESFILANDHEPRALAYELSRKHPGAFRWEDIERGPVWRVRITRVAPR
ncbi:MAG: DUF2249 domain-containing protein [Chloroflexi bacterium]|nr:DUF2249 domain-containing protein [Chloroflexota bacterium]